MSRRKARPSKWIVGVLLVIIAYGIGSERWQPLLLGIGGITTMFFGWLAFRSVVICDVKNRTKAGFCPNPVRGALFGCGRHHWDKVLAWSRYLGTGVIARVLHAQLPLLRWQAGGEQPQPIPQTGRLSYSQPTPNNSAKTDSEYAPPPFVQACNIYVGLVSGLATVAGLAFTIAEFLEVA